MSGAPPKLRRYTWEDCIVKMSALDMLGDSGVNVGLRLASAINWNPTKYTRPGLYWRNGDAYLSVGVSERTGKRGKQQLEAAGLVTIIDGNILPELPANVREVWELHAEYVKHIKAESSTQDDDGGEVEEVAVVTEIDGRESEREPLEVIDGMTVRRREPERRDDCEPDEGEPLSEDERRELAELRHQDRYGFPLGIDGTARLGHLERRAELTDRTGG